MSDWSATQYLKFNDERTRAARDLLAQVPYASPRRVVDLGCGPGNSTELLVKRWPEAIVTGVDSSPAMLAQARKALPDVSFEQADIATWSPPPHTDVIFANAVFQWVPDHLTHLQRLLGSLSEGGVLAVQMPDNLDEPSHQLMRETASQGEWSRLIAEQARPRAPLPSPAQYYDALQPVASRIEIWHSIYNHVMAGPEAIVEWVKGTGLRPFLAPLDGAQRDEFLADYTARIARAYSPRVDGRCLLRFPRLFVVAVR